MAQWVNRLRNNVFVNSPPLPLLCEISGALHLAEPGLGIGRKSYGFRENMRFKNQPYNRLSPKNRLECNGKAVMMLYLG